MRSASLAARAAPVGVFRKGGAHICDIAGELDENDPNNNVHSAVLINVHLSKCVTETTDSKTSQEKVKLRRKK